MLRFEIFYENEMRAGAGPAWAAMPNDDVIAIIFLQEDNHRLKVYGYDEYVLEDGKIIGYNQNGLPNAKRGKLLPDAEYRAILAGIEDRSTIWNMPNVGARYE